MSIAVRRVGVAGCASAAAVLALRGAAAMFPLAPYPSGQATPDQIVATWCGVAARCCAGWLALLAACWLVSVVPGRVGRAASGVAAVLTPRAVRVALHLAVGAGVTAGVSCPALAAPAAPHRPSPRSAATLPVLDRAPTLASGRHEPTHHPPDPHRDRPPAAIRVVVVHRGDSLWRIAARHLGPHPTTRAVAAAWPAWWRANRATIGSTPDVLHVGQRLRVPR